MCLVLLSNLLLAVFLLVGNRIAGIRSGEKSRSNNRIRDDITDW